jgi:hypothetical protein
MAPSPPPIAAPVVYARVGYWDEPVLPGTWVDIAAKYDALEGLAAAAPAHRRPLLRAVAARWPGALREAELVGGPGCRARGHAARAALGVPACTRDAWRRRGAQAPVLWHDLHALLGDQLAWRQRVGTGGHAGFLAALAGAGAARWPTDPAVLERAGGAVVRPRQAYLWLAFRAGLLLSELHLELFARQGHWDRRPSDPEWSRIG